MKKVFIILLNWNNWRETRDCLASLEKADYPDFEVILVDNGSNKNERSAIEGFSRGVSCFVFHVLWNFENLGFAGGNNIGIKFALERAADYILLLNNDTVVAPDFLAKLAEAAKSDKSFGILGSQIYKLKENGERTSEVVFCGGKANRLLTKAEHFECMRYPDGKVPKYPAYSEASAGRQILNTKYSYITGAAMLVKREVIQKIGLMREEYFLYYEDVDWCVRAKRAGFECVIVPQSKVWHKVSATNKEGSPSYIYYHTRNRLLLAKFNGNIFQKISSYILGAWILLKQMPKFFMGPEKKIWAKAITRGALDFYMGRYGKYKERTPKS